MYLDTRRIAVARERSLLPVAVDQCHDEVVDAHQPARRGLSRCHSDSHCRRRNMNRRFAPAPESSSARGRHEEGILQCFRIGNLRRDTFQIASHRMARRAFALKYLLSRSRIADENTRRHHARDVVTADTEAVNVSRDVGNLRGCQRQLRHLAPAVLNHGRNEFAVLIVQNQFRAKEVRPAFTAARVRAVAEIAVHAIERLAAFHRRGVLGRALRKSRRKAAPRRSGRGRRPRRSVCLCCEPECRKKKTKSYARPHASASLQYCTHFFISSIVSIPGWPYSYSILAGIGYFASFRSSNTGLIGVWPSPHGLFGPWSFMRS